MKVEITMVRREYFTETLDLDEGDIAELKNGENDYYDDMDNVPEDEEDCDYDYEAVNLDTGETIILMDN